jgi:hypothetical protein
MKILCIYIESLLIYEIYHFVIGGKSEAHIAYYVYQII